MTKTPTKKEHPAFVALADMVNSDWKLRLKQSKRILIQSVWNPSGAPTYSLRIDGFNFKVYLKGANQPLNCYEQII